MPEFALNKTDYFDLICTATDVINACDDKLMLETKETRRDGPFLMMSFTKDNNEETENGTAFIVRIDFYPKDENEQDFSTKPSVDSFSRAPLKPSICQLYILKDDTYVKMQKLGTEQCFWSIISNFSVPNIESFINENKITFLFRFKIYAYHQKEQTLRDLCFTSLSQNLSADNVAETLKMAEDYGMPQLVNQCVTFMKLNANITEKPNGDLVLNDNAEQITKRTLHICIPGPGSDELGSMDSDMYYDLMADLEEELDNWDEDMEEEDDWSEASTEEEEE